MSGILIVIGMGAALGIGFLFGLASVHRGSRPGSARGEPAAREGVDPAVATEDAVVVDCDAAEESLSVEAASEFQDLLDELGAEPEPDETPLRRVLALREDEVAELRAKLAELAPLGERVGVTEAKLRVAREQARVLEEKRARASKRLHKLQARWRAVPEDARDAATRIARLEERLATAERKKRKEASAKRKAQKELARAEERLEKVRGLLTRSRARSTARLDKLRDLRARAAELERALEARSPAPALPRETGADMPSPARLMRLEDTGAFPRAPRLGDPMPAPRGAHA